MADGCRRGISALTAIQSNSASIETEIKWVCAGKTGKEQRVQVPHGKDLANHAVPESCVVHREVRREALTGVHIGQPLSREMNSTPGADTLSTVEGKTAGALSRAFRRPGVVIDPGMCARSLRGNREISGLTSRGTGLARIGKARSRSR